MDVINLSMISRLLIPVPPLDEQQVITAFLARKTATGLPQTVHINGRQVTQLDIDIDTGIR